MLLQFLTRLQLQLEHCGVLPVVLFVVVYVAVQLCDPVNVTTVIQLLHHNPSHLDGLSMYTSSLSDIINNLPLRDCLIHIYPTVSIGNTCHLLVHKCQSAHVDEDHRHLHLQARERLSSSFHLVGEKRMAGVGTMSVNELQLDPLQSAQHRDSSAH
jgi:hypothetical protein